MVSQTSSSSAIGDGVTIETSPAATVAEARVDIADLLAPDGTATEATAEATAESSRGYGGRNEWLLVFFTATTNTADGVTKVALPLLAARITHSPSLIAGVLAALTLPWLVTAMHVGVLVDRFNRRTLMVAAEMTRLISIGVVLAAHLTGLVSIPLIYVVAVVLGVAEVLALTSAASIVPVAVPRGRWEVANTRITAMEYLCNGFLGSPIGGFLVGAGFAVALGATGGVYVAGMLLLIMLVGDFSIAPGKVHGPMSAQIRESISFLWRHRLLRTMALLITVMAGSWAAWLAIMPAYAVGKGPLHLDSRGYGALLTCLGAGGVIGTLLVGRINRWLGRRWSMFADILGSFVLVAVPAVMPSRPISGWAIGAAAFVAGIGGTMWTVNSRVVIQSLVPNEMLGRFNAASRLLGWGAVPVAAALVGILAQMLNYRWAFGVFAVISALLVVPFMRVVTTSALAEVDGQRAEATAG